MRKKLLLGLLPFVILLAAVGSYAVALFSHLGGAIDVILKENYRSVVAAQNMKEAAERMDSGLFFTLAGEEEMGRKMYNENLPIFRENLSAEMSNITLPGEQEAANTVRDLHEKYVKWASDFLATSDMAQRRQMYFGEMLPTFTKVKDTAQTILGMNQANMLSADEDAKRIASQSTRYMIVAILLGLCLSLVLFARLQIAILRPIRDMTLAAREMGKGNLDQVVPVPSRDELGELANSFNKLAANLRAYRQVTDDEIVRARHMTELTFSSMPDPIFVLRMDGTIGFMNPAAARFISKLEEKHLPAAVEDQVQKILREEPDYLPQTFDRAICFRIDEQEHFVLPRIIGIRDSTGVHGAAVILEDVTRFRLLDQVKTSLVSTVSHELKTPLTSIRMGMHLLLEERIGALNPKQLELLLAAREDSERLLRMINDLLDLARLESEAPRLALQKVAVEDVLRPAVREAEQLGEQRRLRVRLEAEPDLPPVVVELQQIQHVFSNLLSNAAKHSPQGEELLITARREGFDHVRFAVIDHGPGVPKDYQLRVFDRFFRMPGSDHTGAGLGLAIAREIVAAHGGAIGVTAAPNGGSEFYFTLPAHVGPPSPSNP